MTAATLRRRALIPVAALALAPAAARAATDIVLQATDGIRVFGTHRPAEGASRGTVLLFHMAGSNRGEYATIAPALAQRGFDTLAIDQRSGGPGWGRGNETVAALGRETGYLAALPDLEAALAWAVPRGRVVVWGSSYSAALVFLLAARRPGVSALLAFSPGEYLPGTSVQAAAARVHCPAFVTSASDGGEIAEAATILAAVQGSPRRQYRPAVGLHGSQTLRPDRNPRGAEAGWAAVDGFLGEVAPGR